MKRLTQQPVVTALLVLMLAVAGCKGESPTQPPSPGTPPTGNTPPTNPSIALSVSNPNPLVGSTTTITATVTQNGQPVPNGTAVEFTTTFGTFQDTMANISLRTTTNGVASVVLSAPSPGTASVTVRVTNSSALAQVTFVADPVEPQPPDEAPAITSISPSIGSPSGGQIVTISGRNFEGPLRVLFGDQLATIVSANENQIVVRAPEIQLGLAEQARDVTITVITKAGSSSEARATGGPFRYELEILTPRIFHISPASGPNEGNTQIVIFGEGFQAPVRVFFGLGGGATGPLPSQVEAQVVKVTFGQIIAMTPPATGLGAAFANQEVTVRVLNGASNTDFNLPLGFRYGPAMTITAVSPTQGSAFESTRVTIDGWGFDDDVVVTIGGVVAQPISVSGTRIVAQTGLPIVTSCGNQVGPVTVTNKEDGASATAVQTFTFLVPRPSIVSVSPNPVTAGSSVTVGVFNAGGGPTRFTIGGATLLPTGVTIVDGVAVYSIVIPSNLTFDTEDCVTPSGAEGERFINTTFDITYTNVESGCSDTLAGGLTVTPTDTSCRAAAVAAVSPSSLAFGNQAVATSSAPQTVTVSNLGSEPMTITGISSNNADYATTAPTSTTIAGGSSATFQVTFTPSAVGARPGTITVGTSAGDKTVSVSGSGT
ncbi:MAG TPA: IPT/TIG domain-containing protein [Thermoanaerobaculia bacterium]|nr:IPT/TIG domain-containing protein [Thermoanaerobaculia bacterium]